MSEIIRQPRVVKVVTALPVETPYPFSNKQRTHSFVILGKDDGGKLFVRSVYKNMSQDGCDKVFPISPTVLDDGTVSAWDGEYVFGPYVYRVMTKKELENNGVSKKDVAALVSVLAGIPDHRPFPLDRETWTVGAELEADFIQRAIVQCCLERGMSAAA